MATAHYNFPTIVGTDTIDGVNAINGLAQSVDSALFGVAGSIPQAYTLPIAGTTSLGGVRGSGDIAVNATTGDMTINDGVVSASKLDSNAVTTSALLNGSVTSEKLASGVSTSVNNGNNAWTQWSGGASRIGTAMASGCYAYTWGKCVSVYCSGVNIPGNQKTQIGTLGAQHAPAIVVTGLVESSSSGTNRTGFLQVDASGNVYINMVTGQAATESATGVLTFLTA